MSSLPGKDGVQAVLKPLVQVQGGSLQTVLEMACKVVDILAASLT